MSEGTLIITDHEPRLHCEVLKINTNTAIGICAHMCACTGKHTCAHICSFTYTHRHTQI